MIQESQDVWAICELLGHVRIAGKLTEEEKFGSKLARLDIPQDDGFPEANDFMTVYFSGASVYRISIVTEQVARHVCKQTQPAPVAPWDFPKQLTSIPVSHERTFDAEDFQPDDDDDRYEGDGDK